MLVLCLLARITAMKELITTQNDSKVLNFSVANNRYNGNETVTDFFNAVAWGKTAEFISKYFKTGQLIMISGTLVNENYEKDGVKYYTDKIVVNQAEFAGYNKSDISKED